MMERVEIFLGDKCAMLSIARKIPLKTQKLIRLETLFPSSSRVSQIDGNSQRYFHCMISNAFEIGADITVTYIARIIYSYSFALYIFHVSFRITVHMHVIFYFSILI